MGIEYIAILQKYFIAFWIKPYFTAVYSVNPSLISVLSSEHGSMQWLLSDRYAVSSFELSTFSFKDFWNKWEIIWSSDKLISEMRGNYSWNLKNSGVKKYFSMILEIREEMTFYQLDGHFDNCNIIQNFPLLCLTLLNNYFPRTHSKFLALLMFSEDQIWIRDHESHSDNPLSIVIIKMHLFLVSI